MLTKVQDEFGREMPGIFKDPLGTIAIKNDAAFNKYIADKNRAEELVRLKNEVAELHSKMNFLYEKLMNK